ncbi:MAG: FIST N-terminal domain-containing protein [Sideroxyarcus sp.]|nr:FIST N-terminal domain-containing protein [Sideroxyarcus sp.]
MNKKIWFEPAGNLDAFFRNMDAAVAAGARSLFLLSCDANHFPIDVVDRKLSQLPVPVFGGIFPQIIHAQKNFDRGTLVCGLDAEVEVRHIERISDPETDLASQIAEFDTVLQEMPTVIVLLDGVARRITPVLDAIYDALGMNRRYLGGGAGSLEFIQKPCLFSNAGVLADAAQLAGLPMHSGVEVGHGWQVLSGPFLVTRSEGATIHELDYRPAFEVYREQVEKIGEQRFDDRPYFEIASHHPFGLKKWDGDIVVRETVVRRADSLLCVGEFPEGALLYILSGDADELISTVGQVAGRLHVDGGFVLAFDCVGRSLFLGGRYPEEVAAMTQALPDGVPVFGALTVGEIAGRDEGCLEYYNKTIVMGAFSGE